MKSKFTKTLNEFYESEKEKSEEILNIAVIQFSTEDELNELAFSKKKNIKLIDLSHFSKTTLEQARYLKSMREQYNLNLYIRVGEWRKRGQEEFKLEVFGKDGVVFSGYYIFMNEFLADCLEPLKIYESAKLRGQFEQDLTAKPMAERKLKL